MKIQILVDDKQSWYNPYAKILVKKIQKLGHNATLLNSQKDVTKGDMLFLLSCKKIFKNLSLNKYNLCIHASDLPCGKGWSPISWYILNNQNEITFTLFEVNQEIDSGKIYLQKKVYFNGDELFSEIKLNQVYTTSELVLDFINKAPNVESRSQVGESTFFRKRIPDDSELDINLSIKEQFNLLRICDNENYPAFFNYKNNKYYIKIFKENEK